MSNSPSQVEQNSPYPPPAGEFFIAGCGEIGRLVREKDWSQTPLGPIATWSPTLLTTVNLCLTSHFPLSIAWGPQHIQLYNAPYAAICGDKHPQALGQNFTECWASAFPVLGHTFRRALAGTASFLENQRMFIDRRGYLEESFFTFSFTPIQDGSRNVAGVVHLITETTEKMLAQRRTELLHRVTVHGLSASSLESAIQGIAETLAGYELDLPFALLYRLDDQNQTARLVSQVGLPPDSVACPATMDITQADTTWPLAPVSTTGSPLRVDDVRTRCDMLVCGPYPEPIEEALILPLTLPGHHGPTYFLVAGISTRLPMDEPYRDFLKLLATTMGNVMARSISAQNQRWCAETVAAINQATRNFFANINHECKRTNRALRTITECNQLLVRATDEQTLLDGVCRLLVEHGGYRLAWVGFAEQNTEKSVLPVAQAGFENGYLDTVDITWADNEHGRGPTGTAIRMGRSVIARNIPTDPTYAVWREAAIKRGYISTISLPLIHQEHTFGALNAYATTVDAFDPAEETMLNELASDLAYGLAMLRMRVEHQDKERLIRQQQNLLNSITKGTSDAIYVKDIQGRYMIANPATLEFLEKPLQAVLGLDDTALFLPEEAGFIMDGDRRVMASNATQSYEERVTLLGETRIFSSTKGPVHDEQGRVIGLFGIARDITERRKMILALQHERDFSNAILDALPGIFYCYDEELTFRRWNKNFEIVTGYSAAEIARMSPLDFFTDADKSLLATRIQEVFAQGMSEVEADLVAKDGSRKPYFFNGLTTIIEGQKHLVGFGIDLATLRQAETERDRFFNLSLDMMCIAGLDGYFKQLNPAWGKTLGWSENELCSRPWLAFVHPEDQEIAQQKLTKLASGWSVNDYENRFQCKNGTYRWISWNAFPLPEDNLVFAVARDITAHKEAENKLWESREQLRFVTDHAPVMLAHCDQEQRYKFVNKPYADMFGMKVSDFLGKHPRDILGEQPYEHALPKMETALRGQSVEYDLTLPVHSGVERYLHVHYQPELDIDGSVQGFVAAIADITERKQAEEERQRFFMLAESSSDFIGMCDLDMQPNYVNPAGIRMVGLPDMPSALQVKVQDFFYPEDQDFISEVFFPQVLQKGHGDVEIRLRHFQTGEPIWMFYYLFSVRDANGKAIGWATVSRDITERKQMDEELRLSKKRFSTAFHASPAGMVITRSADGKFIEFNEAFLTMFEFTREEVIGRTALELKIVAPEERAALIQGQQDANGLHNHDLQTKTRSGKIRHVLFSSNPIELDGKECHITTLIDVTDRKQAEEEILRYRDHLQELVKERTAELTEANLHLQDLDRLKSMFIASMSHELRTPLNSIIGFTGIILMGMSGEISAVQRKQLEMVQKSANHLLELINDVIDVSKIETEQTELSIEPFDLSSLILEIKELFLPIASGKGLLLEWKSPGPVIVRSDRRRVRQILINLTGNALKFTERGSVSINLIQSATGVDVSVHDTGTGIAEEDMELLFIAFSRIHIKQRPLVEGTGLGLYLSQKIAALLGGAIHAESECDKGSTFILSLPWNSHEETA